MKNAKHADMELGLKRLEALLRWREGSGRAAADDLHTRIGKMRGLLNELESVMADADRASARTQAVASDNMINAMGALLRARRAEEAGLAHSEICRQLFEIASAQAAAWTSFAQHLRPPVEAIPPQRPSLARDDSARVRLSQGAS